MSFDQDTLIHLFAGGCGGTMGAIATCPLEVVKTRLQSSSFSVMMGSLPPAAATRHSKATTCHTLPPRRRLCTSSVPSSASQVVHLSQPADPRPGLPRYIVEVEGPRALWRGLGPNLVGVAPSRAIYFCSYSQMKKFLNNNLHNSQEGPLTHILSASWAGFMSCTATNPIWFVKTRVQLDSSKAGHKVSTLDTIKNVYRSKGILGFYKGMTASYYGISETVIHFVIYEFVKAKLQERRQSNPDVRSTRDFIEFMGAGAMSKTIASSLCYPHEVARTRLRECSVKYRGFWQTLGLVLREEGYHGLYRGLSTQLIRQIPNTAIMMATYEAVVYVLTRYCGESEFYEDFE
ncbi:Mitochondrial substrate/solute carrier [Trinorchestia longiramus]|nr:Mitochondrial substrate/solute carrier [Trinorchestia longiramus]